MASNPSTLATAAGQAGRALARLADLLTENRVLDLFNELGFFFPPELVGNSNFVTALGKGAEDAAKLPDLIVALDDALDADIPTLLEATGNLLDVLIDLAKKLDDVADALKALKDDLPGVDPDALLAFAGEFTRRLLDYLVITHLEANFPRLKALLALFGVVEVLPGNVGSTDPALRTFLRRELRLENVPVLFKSPQDFMLQEYRWGAGDFDGELLLERLHELLFAFTVPAGFKPATATLPASIEILLFTLQAKLDPPPRGLEATLTFGLDDSFTLDFPFFVDGWSIEVTQQGRLDAGLSATITPPGDLTINAPAGGLNGKTSLSVIAQNPTRPLDILALPGVGRLTSEKARASIGVEYKVGTGGASAGEPVLEFKLEKAQFNVDTEESNGLLQAVTPKGGVAAPGVDFGIGWSRSRGVFFTGGALETTIAVNSSVGPFTIDFIRVKLGLSGDGKGLDVDLGVAARGEIGPVKVTFDGLGVSTQLALQRGRLGPVDLDLSFLLPTGLGIAVEAGPVSGGGFLFFDEKAGRYGGAVELSVYGVAVKAFGVIDTKFPDGSKGFSFVIVISAEFTPIQLGFGFTLLGVGGLVGINRTLDQDALRGAIRSHGLDNILFPHDVVENAPAIIHDLTAIFPASEGRYVFGPLAKFGWGTPTVIDAELGLILVLPGPLLALLGEVHSTLPNQESALVNINIAIAGVLDFPQKKFSLDGSLHDSKVGQYTLSGDMAMRLSWGASSSFALSVGGFNPGFTPPSGFPALARVAVDMGLGGNPAIRHEGYLAVTSNTLQIGARSQITAHGGGIDLDGHLGWDALFVLSPFSFTATFDAGVSVRFHGHGIGVHLHGEISGPSPWRVKGEVCVSILFWDACLGFDKTFGGEPRVELPAIDPFLGSPDNVPLEQQAVVGLKNALEDARNWSSLPPTGSFTVVTLAQRKEGDEAPPPVDPLGAGVLHQRVVPLNRKITLYAGVKPLGPGQYSVDSVTVSNGIAVSHSFVQDDFAPASFKKMSDAEKLSNRSFEPMDAGVKLVSDEVKVGSIVPHGVAYHTIVVGGPPGSPPSPDPQPGPEFTLTDRHLAGMTARSATALFGMRVAGAERFVDSTAKPKVGLLQELFVVAQRGALAAAPNFVSTTTRSAATLALEAAVAATASLASQLHVIPFHELPVAFPTP